MRGPNPTNDLMRTRKLAVGNMSPSGSSNDNQSASSIVRSLTVYVDLLKSRIQKIFGYPFSAVVATVIASQGHPPLIDVTIIALSMFALTTCVYLYNDVSDRKMDRLSPRKQNRPLVAGRASVEEVMRVVYINAAIGFVLALYLRGVTAILIMSYFFVFMLYSYPPVYIKKRFPFKEITIASGAIFTALIGGSAVGNISGTLLFFTVIMFGFTYLTLAVFGETLDMYEDEIYGVKTISMVLRWRTRVSIFAAFLFAVMVLTPFTWVQFKLNLVFPVLVVGSCLIFLRYLIPLASGLEEAMFWRAVKAMYAFWILVFVAFIIGSYRP